MRPPSVKRADFTDGARILRPLSVKRADFTDGKCKTTEFYVEPALSPRMSTPPPYTVLKRVQRKKPWKIPRLWWEQRESNPRPSACKADALNQLSYAPETGLQIYGLFFILQIFIEHLVHFSQNCPQNQSFGSCGQ